MMQAVGISHNKFPTNKLGDELDGGMAVITHTKFFYFIFYIQIGVSTMVLMRPKEICKFLTMRMEGWLLCDIM
jgi:hypothetical protein